MEALAMQIILPKGDPNGIKIIELTGWNGKAFVVPRVEIGSQDSQGQSLRKMLKLGTLVN